MRFKTNLIVRMLCVVLAGIAIFSLSHYFLVKSKTEKEAYARYNSIIATIATEADTWLIDIKNMGQAAADSDVTAPDDFQDWLKWLAHWDSVLHECMYAYGYENIVIALDNKRIYISPMASSVNGFTEHTNIYQTYSWYTEVKRTGKLFIHGPFFVSSLGEVLISINVPIFDSANNFAGVAAIFTYFQKLKGILDNISTANHDIEQLSIITANQTIMATSSDEQANLMKKLDALNANDDKYQLYFRQKLTEADWYVSLKIDERSILKDVNKSLRLSVISFAISFTAMLVLVLLLLYTRKQKASVSVASDIIEIEQDLTVAEIAKSPLDIYVETCLLTARERQVLDILMQGKTDKEIACELDIAVGTVQTHLKRIYHKTETVGRFALINKLENMNSNI